MSIDALTSASAVDQEVLERLFTDAHTASVFAETPIEDEVLEHLHALTRMPPTAMNIQPLRIVWVRSAEGQERLASFMNENNSAKTAAAPLVAVLAYDLNWHEHLATLAPFRLEAKDSFAANEPLRSGMATLSAHMQAGYFLLAARTLGLDVGPMTGFDAAGIDREFLSEQGWRSFAVVNLGYPAADGAGYRPRGGRLGFDEQTLTV